MSKKKRTKKFFHSNKDEQYKYYSDYIESKYNEYLKGVEKEREKGRLMRTFSKKEFKDVMNANLTMKEEGQLKKRSPLAQTIKDSQEFTSKRAQKWAEKYWAENKIKRKMTGHNMGYYIQQNVDSGKWYRHNGRVYDVKTDQLIY